MCFPHNTSRCLWVLHLSSIVLKIISNDAQKEKELKKRQCVWNLYSAMGNLSVFCSVCLAVSIMAVAQRIRLGVAKRKWESEISHFLGVDVDLKGGTKEQYRLMWKKIQPTASQLWWEGVRKWQFNWCCNLDKRGWELGIRIRALCALIGQMMDLHYMYVLETKHFTFQMHSVK